MNYLFILLLFLTPIGKAFSQSHRNTNLESAKELFKKTERWLILKEFDSVLLYNKTLFEQAKLDRSEYYLGQHYYIKSYYFDQATTKVDSTYFYALKAKENFLKTKDSLLISQVSLFIAELENEEGLHHSSNSAATDAIRYFSKESNKRLKAITYDIIADNYLHLELYDDAFDSQIKSINLKTSDSLFYRNNLASICSQQNNYAKAVELLQEVNIQDIDDFVDKAMIIDNLAYYQWKQNPNKNVVPQLFTALKIREKINDISGLIDSYESLATYYSTIQPKEALRFTKKMILSAKKLSQSTRELDGLKLLMEIDEKDLSSRNRYIVLKDSLELIRLKTRNQYAKIKYDNTKALQENENLKQKNKQQKLSKKFYGVLAFLVSITLLFYFIYSLQKRKLIRQKHDQEKLQEVYKTENKISKKIHDEIANGIHQVMSGLERDKDIEVSKIKKLYSLYNRTRDISQEFSEINLEENYINELKGLFSNYQNIHTNIIIKGIDDMDWHTITTIKKETLYRVLNELMTNMKKHSNAKLIVIIFNKLKNNLEVTYKDNGVGFDKSILNKGSGFKNMENRILSLQGSFTFESGIHAGLKVGILFPI